MIRILFVDDEIRVIHALKEMLAPLANEWKMAFAKNGLEALTQLSQQRFDVVVSDFAMPGMDGPALLKEVMRRYPDTIRFIQSSPEERDHVYRSIGPTHQFLTKPSTLTTLHRAVERSITLRDRLQSSEIREVIGKIGMLPSAPKLYQQLIQTIDAPDSSLKDAGQIISLDLGMSAKVLQLVNSAFFGVPIRVADPVHATVLLGLDIIKSLVAWFHVATYFNTAHCSDFDIEQLQRHSSTVAAYARQIALDEGYSKNDADDIFLAGLFHDTGQLILANKLPENYQRVLSMVNSKWVPLLTAEQLEFGTNHAQVGAYLLSLWGFADPVVEACMYHHQPDLHDERTLSPVSIIYIADYLEYHFTAIEQGTEADRLNMRYITELGLEKKIPLWQARCARMRMISQS